MIILNSIICLLIAARIMLFERNASLHRPLISALAYIIAVASGIEAICGLMGIATTPSYSTVVLNSVLCAALYCLKGNVAELFKNPNSHCSVTRLLRWHSKQHNPRKV